MAYYTPAHLQPLTLAEAKMLDTPVIIQEISRLQSSIQHLQTSQEELDDFLKNEEDKDVRDAFEENKQVILSQSERITMLKFSLQSRGMLSSSHYDLQPPTTQNREQPEADQAPSETPEENGVFL